VCLMKNRACLSWYEITQLLISALNKRQVLYSEEKIVLHNNNVTLVCLLPLFQNTSTFVISLHSQNGPQNGYNCLHFTNGDSKIFGPRGLILHSSH
jgi:hypothetical protein